MLGPKTDKFLEAQRQRMVALDMDESQPGDSPSYLDKATGKKVPAFNIVYENMINWLRSEQAEDALGRDLVRAEQSISEDTLATYAPTLTTYLLPIIRRLYHRIIARELVSIQPIPNPSAYVYYLNKTYTSTVAGTGVTAGDRTDTATTSSYASSGEQSTIYELQMRLRRLLIEVINYKLKADWTLEAEQDWRSQYKLSVEEEMISEVGDEIAREVDRLIIAALIAGAAYTVNWDPTAYRSGDTNISTHRHAYETELYNALCDAEAWIVQNKRGVTDSGVQWNLVMNGNNWARFKKMEHWNITTVEPNTDVGIGRRYEGVIGGRYKVYVSPEMSDCYILMTIKKDWKFAVGYYAPYIPMYVSPKYIISDDFTQFAKGAMSRFAYGVVPETYNGSTNNGIVLINLCVS